MTPSSPHIQQMDSLAAIKIIESLNNIETAYFHFSFILPVPESNNVISPSIRKSYCQKHNTQIFRRHHLVPSSFSALLQALISQAQWIRLVCCFSMRILFHLRLGSHHWHHWVLTTGTKWTPISYNTYPQRLQER